MPATKDPAKIGRNCWRIYGCSPEEALRLNGGQPLRMLRTPAMLYAGQRGKAAIREIEWRLTFPQWWEIWQASGKWEQRGRGQGCVMARNGDAGPYAVGNVYICTNGQNVKDGYSKTSGFARAAKRFLNPGSDDRAALGRGRGYTILPGNRKRPYQVMVGKDRVGYFATAEEATAAYLEACEIRRQQIVGRMSTT